MQKFNIENLILFVAVENSMFIQGNYDRFQTHKKYEIIAIK